jgi:hypothetical protein
VRTQSTASYLKTLRTLLEGVADLARLALLGCDGVRPASTTVLLHQAASHSLADVAMIAALDPQFSAALTAAVSDAGEVPSIPQHGDFWWQNVLMANGHVWAIDFDAYGDVRVPLYDALTMMITTMPLRPSAAGTGIERLLAGGAEARACRELLAERATASGLTPSQMDGVLVYYLAHMASTVNGRAGEKFSGPHVADLRHAAQLLASGKRGLLAPG